MRLLGCNAPSLRGQAKGGKCSRQRRDARGRQTNRVLHVSVRDPARRLTAQRLFWSVVGRSSGGPHYGSYYRERGIRRIARQSLRPKLRIVTPVNLSASSKF